MQGRSIARRAWMWKAAGWIALVSILVWLRALVWQAAVQLFLGLLVALCALPVTKRLERRFSSGAAAALALGVLGAAVAGALLMLLPPLLMQGRQLTARLPELFAGVKTLFSKAQQWLNANGIPAQEMLWGRSEAALGKTAAVLMNWMGGMAGGIGQWLLSPMIAFYFLRDRRRIARWLMMLLPPAKRGMAVRLMREMRRETAGYLRGQLMVSAAVGMLTAVGLLFCGLPSWLALGVLMGVLEMIPYAGPFLGGVLTAVFALPLGVGRMLWALGVVMVVQQLEGSVLSPQLMGGATRLHPVVILLSVTLGAAAAGVAGMLLAAPLILCLRAAYRVVCEQSVHDC